MPTNIFYNTLRTPLWTGSLKGASIFSASHLFCLSTDSRANNPCRVHAPCRQGQCSFQDGGYVCKCSPGYTGQHCAQGTVWVGDEQVEMRSLRTQIWCARIVVWCSKTDEDQTKPLCLCRKKVEMSVGQLWWQKFPIYFPDSIFLEVAGPIRARSVWYFDCDVVFLSGTELNECELTRPCLNGGTCHDHVNNFTCSCVDGYYGRRCETGTPSFRLLQTLPCACYDVWNRHSEANMAW